MHKRDIAGVDRVAQALPGGVVGRVHQLADVARIHQLGPRIHAEQIGVRAGDQRRQRGGGDFRQIAQQLHVGRRVAEMIVGDQRAVRFAAELAELAFVDLLEQRALVPARAGIELEIAIEFGLADVHHADFQRRVGLRIVDEIVQAAPRALQLLELGRVKDFVHLRRELFVETRDHLLDRVDDVALDEARVRERLGDQGLHGVLDFARGALAARLEILLEQGGEIVRFGDGRRFRRDALLFLLRGHCASPYSAEPSPEGFWLSFCFIAAISCGSASNFLSESSAATLPSM